LLDNSDANIGNSTPSNPSQIPTTAVDANPPRILSLDAQSTSSQMVTVALMNTIDPNALIAAPGSLYGGPLVGILEFGNGSVFTRVEVDIPIGRFLPNASHTIGQPQDGGVIVSVPAGTLRVYARNDGNVIPTTANGFPTGSNLPGITDTQPISLLPRSTIAKAFVTYYTRPGAASRPTRTQYLYLNNTDNTGVFDGAGQTFNIPPFARTLRLIRSQPTGVGPSPGNAFIPPPASLFFGDSSGNRMDGVVIASGDPSPVISVPGPAVIFNVAGGPFSLLAAEFGIEV
jgi:hypothetical protein